MQEALEQRRRIFLLYGVLVFGVIGVTHVLARGVKGGDPDVTTVLLWAAMVIEVPVLTWFLFRPARLAKMKTPEQGKTSVADVGRSLSALAVALATVPTLFGFVLTMTSGDVWRMYLFVPITLVAAAIYWQRIGAMLQAYEGGPAGRA